jgi:glycosyltransferase involved in cell wall biosynthesis
MVRDERSPIPETKSLSLSVVVATYNRGQLLSALLKNLSTQTLPPEKYELVVVDDGSREPVRPIIESFASSLAIRFIEQENAGQAAARDRGVSNATGDVVVIVDDDMKLASDFLEKHLAWHQRGYRVVLGRILSSRDLKNMPLFERFHADQLEKFHASMLEGGRPRGTDLCTGNVSFRREDYHAIGGFDRNLLRSEDRDLGIRLEHFGAPFVFGHDTETIHDSDHVDLDVWLRRAFNYGVYDTRIADKHPGLLDANPWRFLFMVNPLTRPLVLAVTVFPNVGKGLTKLAWSASEWCDNHGLNQMALRGTTVAYGLEYFRGMRAQAGSLARAMGNLAAFVWRNRKTENV